MKAALSAPVALFAAAQLALAGFPGVRPDVAEAVSRDVPTDSFVERTTIQPFGGYNEGYWCRRDVVELASNGLFRVDYRITKGQPRRPKLRPDLSVLLFRPLSPPGSADTNVVDLSRALALQRRRTQPQPAITRNPNLALRTIEHSLLGAEFFEARAADYLFRGESTNVSFVTQLPAWFPGLDPATAGEPRRVTVRHEHVGSGIFNVVLEHVPIVRTDDTNQVAHVLLAKDALLSMGYYDPVSEHWTNSWTATNSMPARISMLLFKFKWIYWGDYFRVADFARRIFALPGSTVPLALQQESPVLPPPLPALVLTEAVGDAQGTAAESVNSTRLRSFRSGDTELEWLGRSGVELARYVLAQESASGFHALNQRWAGGPGEEYSAVSNLPLQQFPLGGSSISLAVVDFDRQAHAAVGLSELSKLNVNTAPASALETLPMIDSSVAAAIVQRRAGPDGIDGTADDLPFRNITELASVPGMTAQLVASITPDVTVSSSAFEVTATVKRGRDTRTYVAWLWRKPAGEINVLRFYVK